MENEQLQTEITDFTLPDQKWNVSWRNKMKYIRFEMNIFGGQTTTDRTTDTIREKIETRFLE